jgi:peptide deformylase
MKDTLNNKIIACECGHLVSSHQPHPTILGEQFREKCNECNCEHYKNMEENKTIEAPVIEHGFMQEVTKEELATEIKDNKKEEPTDFTLRLVKPHTKVSRDVITDDLPRVLEEAKVLYNLCYSLVGIYPGAHAMAHPQIDDKDPLRFFVTANKEIIINPKITRHTKTPVDSKEGCMSYSDQPKKMVGRYHKVEVDYQTLDNDGKLTEVMHSNIQGKNSFITQHEVDHLDAKYIY